MIKRFLPSGYADVESIINLGQPFTFIIGGRGTGKTYGALKYVIENEIMFMLMRRTQTQTDLINKPEFSPFKALEDDMRKHFIIKPVSKYNAAVMDDQDDPGIYGYTCALSTLSNLRGFDASDIEILIYDEFIPEKHERPIKNEGSAFLNAYETMNRNRELKGKKPLQVLALANAFDIANPIFRDLDLISICDRMRKKNHYIYINKQRGVCIVMLDGSEISEKKKDTALYRLAAGSAYNEMALSNDFVYNSDENIKPQRLDGYKPFCGVGGIYIYKHKSDKTFYVSNHRSGVCPYFEDDEMNLKRFLSSYGRMLYRRYISNQVLFEDQLTKTTFEWYII